MLSPTSTTEDDTGPTARNAFFGASSTVTQADQVHGGVHIYSSPERQVLRPRQLPADVAGFTGRTSDLGRLDKVLGVSPPSMVSLVTVSGLAGIGKTALVVHWAQRVRDRFQDGDLYVDLRGYSPDPPLRAEDVLERFLCALGVPTEQVPGDVGSRAALYRSLLDGRRMLIVLDNAASSQQVRSLLPGSPGCVVVVTSRRRLSSLVSDGANTVPLDPMFPHEATTLLAKIIGTTTMGQRQNALAALAHRCGYLPLALRIAAASVVARPGSTVADLNVELASEQQRLQVLTDDETIGVRASFWWSYRALPPDVARLFRMAGLHAGQRMGVAVIAALADITPKEARRLLAVLVNGHLIDQIGRERYRWHPLVRLYAAECARTEDSLESRQKAVFRMLDWYLNTAQAADGTLKEIATTNGEQQFTTQNGAIAWYELERTNVALAVRQAAREGYGEMSWRLAYACSYFFLLRKHYTDWLHMARVGHAAAKHIWDERGEAYMLIMLGLAAAHRHRNLEAARFLCQALAVWWAIGDRTEARWAVREIGRGLQQLRTASGPIWYELTEVVALTNRPREAVNYLRQVLAAYLPARAERHRP